MAAFQVPQTHFSSDNCDNYNGLIYNALFKVPNAHTLKPLLIHTSLIQVEGTSSPRQNHFIIWSFKKKNHVSCCVVLCRLSFQLSNSKYVRVGFPLGLNNSGFLFMLFYIRNKKTSDAFYLFFFTNTSLEKQFAEGVFYYTEFKNFKRHFFPRS